MWLCGTNFNVKDQGTKGGSRKSQREEGEEFQLNWNKWKGRISEFKQKRGQEKLSGKWQVSFGKEDKNFKRII